MNENRQRTIYGARKIIAEPTARTHYLAIQTTQPVRVKRLRIDGDDRCRAGVGIREVKHCDACLLRAQHPVDNDLFVHVQTLERTQFNQLLKVGEIFTVEIETWVPDVDVCLVADVEIEP